MRKYERLRNLRRYGKAPFNVAVIHGGPGAVGEMAPVARELASGWGVLEPLQTATSLEGQIEELRAVLVILLKNCGHMPWIERQARDRFYGILNEELRKGK